MLNQALKNTLTFILAGGRGERLKPLTELRAKPAVPFGGNYRIIDFTLSNCIHSGLRRIFVLTQYQTRSLEEHIRFGWNFLPRRLEQFIVTRPPQHGAQRSWYLGTADAIYHNIDSIRSERADHIIVLSGDHIYRMDYGKMLRDHLTNNAELTIGAVRIPTEESRRFGILEVDERGQVQSFLEKPERGPEIPGSPGMSLGSMGIYIFSREELIRRLEEDHALGEKSGHDFGHDVIPRMIPGGRVYAHHFVEGKSSSRPSYWRDVGTIDAYFDANLDLCNPLPQFDLYNEDWPTYTQWHNDPPAKTLCHGEEGKSLVVDSLLCPGVIVDGARVQKSILSNRVRIARGAELRESILFRGAQVGEGARLRKVIVDKWTKIPAGESIGYDLDRDRERFTVSENGVVVVPRQFDFGSRTSTQF